MSATAATPRHERCREHEHVAQGPAPAVSVTHREQEIQAQDAGQWRKIRTYQHRET
jgi:hypothetical protein